MAALARFTEAQAEPRAGRWPMLEITQEGIGELGTQVVGLAGLGSVGRALAARLQGGQASASRAAG